MKDLLQKFLAWLVVSPWGKKYAGWIGVAALTSLVWHGYWKPINQTLQAWGISDSTFVMVLWVIASITLPTASIILSKMKQGQDANCFNPQQAAGGGAPALPEGKP